MEHVSLAFRGVRALNDVSFDVAAGSVTALIGPNGAGKTTIFNCINRVLSPDAGSIEFEGHELTALRAPQLAGVGIARTFQHAALFGSMNVRDNVQIGVDVARRAGRNAPPLLDVLKLLDLEDAADSSPAGLPLGTQKRVELARAIASGPKLLLLDEPAGGLTQDEVLAMRDLLLRLKDALTMTLLLVEHHVNMVMSMSERVIVMSSGEVITQGSPEEVRADARVVQAYLGGAAA